MNEAPQFIEHTNADGQPDVLMNASAVALVVKQHPLGPAVGMARLRARLPAGEAARIEAALWALP